MAWIELHQSLLRHPKLIRLAVLLNVKKQDALWHLVSLWLWALDYAEDGDLKGFGAREIADAADYSADADAFVSAFREAGWLDKNRLHDWMDYAGRLVEKRTANRDRMRAKRAEHVQRTTDARAGATVPYRTVPNHNTPLTPQGGRRARTPFVKPSVEEVSAYCRERNNGIDAAYFVDSNDAKGWLVGKTKTPMVDWKATIRTWEKNAKQHANGQPRPRKNLPSITA